MTLFELPPTNKKRPRKITAADIAAKDIPIWEVTAGLTRYYVKALNDDHAIRMWRFRYGHPGVHDDELKVRRLYHSDIVELCELDPKLARKLSRL